MYIQVLPLKGITTPLWYKENHNAKVGNVVLVPVRNQIIPAIVIQRVSNFSSNYEIKSIISIEKFPSDELFLPFIKNISYYSQTPPLALIKRFRSFIEQKNKTDIKQEEFYRAEEKKSCLSADQLNAYQKIAPNISAKKYQATILHGVTGSGKTEVYKHLIEEAQTKNKSVIMLLPEVTLALKFEKIMQNYFSKIPVFGFHSASTAKQKQNLWQKLNLNESCLIIGVHLPILLPIPNLGLIIVDEEHDTGYQEKKHPRINSKEAAIMRAHQYGIPIVLGSATPSISSLHNLSRPSWQRVSMPKRFAGAFPKIKVVRLGKEKKQPHFLISKELANSIQNRLNRKEQIIIFLNRRGYSFFVQCKPCGFIFYCPDCSVSLTLHHDNALRCHYCDFKTMLEDHCPECKEKKLLKKGVGTQQIVSVLEKIFPYAKIARADLDTTVKKREWEDVTNKFSQKEIDILVGTQTITKGYHFPGVTLVGILWADINLHMPVYNAAENALQQILQVAGRAGRQSNHSEVIVQAMSEHPIFNYLDEKNYLDFYASEIEKRKISNYPPIVRLAEIELKHESEDTLIREIDNLCEMLEKNSQQISIRIDVLGPVKPIISKLKKWHIRKIYLKSQSVAALIELFSKIDRSSYLSKINLTQGPLS